MRVQGPSGLYYRTPSLVKKWNKRSRKHQPIPPPPVLSRRPGTLSALTGLMSRKPGKLKVKLLLIQSQAFLQAFFFLGIFLFVNIVTY